MNEKLDLKNIGGYTAAILIFMSCMRLILEAQILGVPIMNFVSFSNLIIYSMDIVYGMTWFIIVGAVIVLFRSFINKAINTALDDYKLKSRFTFGLIVVGICISIAIAILYWGYPTTKGVSLALRILISLNIALAGIFCNYIAKVQDKNFLFLILIFSFAYFYTKIIISRENNSRGSIGDNHSVIVFKDSSRKNFTSDSTRRLVTNTIDFAFIYNLRDSTYTAIPMAEIFAINSNGVDSKRKNEISRDLKTDGW